MLVNNKTNDKIDLMNSKNESINNGSKEGFFFLTLNLF